MPFHEDQGRVLHSNIAHILHNFPELRGQGILNNTGELRWGIPLTVYSTPACPTASEPGPGLSAPSIHIPKQVPDASVALDLSAWAALAWQKDRCHRHVGQRWRAVRPTSRGLLIVEKVYLFPCTPREDPSEGIRAKNLATVIKGKWGRGTGVTRGRGQVSHYDMSRKAGILTTNQTHVVGSVVVGSVFVLLHP